jgi:hypothetical protein
MNNTDQPAKTVLSGQYSYYPATEAVYTELIIASGKII